MKRKRIFSSHWLALTIGVCLLSVVGATAFGEVWSANPAPTPPTITAPSGPLLVGPGENVTCTCTRGSDKDTLGASACEPGVQYDDVMATNGNYPEWVASGGSWLNGNNKGTSVVWVAPTELGEYTIYVKDDDLPTAILPPHTGSRNDSPASSASVPALVGNITQDHDVWWFNGCDAHYYSEAGTLTLNGPSSSHTFNWTVAQGTDKIDFSNGLDAQTVTNSNSVGFESTGASVDPNDVKVEVTVTGVSGKASKQFRIYAPKSLTHLPDYDEDLPDLKWGYVSYICYSIQNQFGSTLPWAVEVNEQWTSDKIPDYPGMDWTRCDPGGGMAAPYGWDDECEGEIWSRTPTPQHPQNPIGTAKVYHWTGDWYAGSVTPGEGVKVLSVTWQKYRDHCRHE